MVSAVDLSESTRAAAGLCVLGLALRLSFTRRHSHDDQEDPCLYHRADERADHRAVSAPRNTSEVRPAEEQDKQEIQTQRPHGDDANLPKGVIGVVAARRGGTYR